MSPLMGQAVHVRRTPVMCVSACVCVRWGGGDLEIYSVLIKGCQFSYEFYSYTLTENILTETKRSKYIIVNMVVPYV